MVTTLILAWDFFGSENTVILKILYADYEPGLLWWLEFIRRMERPPSTMISWTTKNAISLSCWRAKGINKFIFLWKHVASTSMALMDSYYEEWFDESWEERDGLRQVSIAAHVHDEMKKYPHRSLYINMSGHAPRLKKNWRNITSGNVFLKLIKQALIQRGTQLGAFCMVHRPGTR